LNCLHEHGHVDPRRYTPAQIHFYFEAIMREERQRRRERVVEARIATLPHDEFVRQLRRLERDD
jgi:hypothetical protein